MRHRVAASVKGDRFRLTLPALDEKAEHVTLRGMVSPAPGGGSIVRASFRSGSPEFWLLIAGVGALVLFSSRGWGLLLMAVAAAQVALGEWRDARVDEDSSPTAAYLAERLRGAVHAALPPSHEQPRRPGRDAYPSTANADHPLHPEAPAG